MKIIIVGAGPTGLTLGAALARRGNGVDVIDRDGGPAPDGSWERRGVMQFHQAHGFRPQVRELLLDEWPEAWRAWLELGAEPVAVPSPDGAAPLVAVRSRRITYERALRRAAGELDGLNVVAGAVSALIERNGRIAGVVVDGAAWEADLVVDASGRLSRLAAPPERGGNAGMAYVSRTFRRPPGAEPGPISSPFAWSGRFVGYDAYVFPHEHGHISAVIIRPTADAGLGVLRRLDAFEAACRAIPGLSEWTGSATPTSGVMVGAGLLNTYRPQAGRPGLVALGDSLATTAPTAGRGIAMASMQIRALLDLLDGGAGIDDVTTRFAPWCDANIRPWVQDHLDFDAETVRRWQGHDLDLSGPLTSTAIVDASQADPRIAPLAAPFLAMTALPASLSAAEPLARAVYATGWRPPSAEGPTRDELLALAAASRSHPRSSPATTTRSRTTNRTRPLSA
ncbi:MAG: FAD-dependent oxidoreductase [Acidimicrobiales bacterium]